ncbi:MAG: arginyltransferase [Rhodospirillales bacterium]|jgi:leucyl-tRNA---protein transferase|nr:arginyltransferase [Rhodospirillales bacterium]
MRHEAILGSRFFFATGLMPCPYLPGRLERRVVTELAGRDAPLFHDILSQAGFRRSHDIVYAPACPDCSECKAVRVISGRFKPTKSMRRVLNTNADLAVETVPPTATDEQFALFSTYQSSRHRSGEMARMDDADYQALIENSPVETRLVEFRDPDGALIACCLVDRLGDGLSAVYSFFDSTSAQRSLGTHMILWTIGETQRHKLPYTYLGYWIADCQKMAYKARFRPVEAYTTEGWKALT